MQVVKYSYSKGGNFCSNAQKNDILIKTLGGDSYFNNQKLVMPFSCQPQHSFIFIGTYCHPEGQAKANAQPGWLNIHTKETNPWRSWRSFHLNILHLDFWFGPSRTTLYTQCTNCQLYSTLQLISAWCQPGGEGCLEKLKLRLTQPSS